MSNAEHSPKHYTPDEKVSILRRHLIDGVAVSTLCDEHHLRPTAFYRWLKQFFENGAAAFGPAPRADKQVEARDERIALLEAKLKKKDEVLAELMEEHVALKKKAIVYRVVDQANPYSEAKADRKSPPSRLP